MFAKRISNIISIVLLCAFFTVACAKSTASATPPTPGPGQGQHATSTPTSTASPSGAVQMTPAPSATTNARLDSTPTHYKTRLLLVGRFRPDDLAFDPSGHLVFSDVFRGVVARLNADGSVTTLVEGLAEPEGLVYLRNGTLIIAEQQTNRILAYSAVNSSLTVLRVLPGRPGNMTCKNGVDGIALDPTTNTLIIPDSPTGNVYRMSLDGKRLTLLATRISRPVGATVDSQGNIFVADECGGALWQITPAGRITRIGGFGMLDDVACDHHGNLLVTDLKATIHALVRIRRLTGKREILANRGLIEPQGLLIDNRDNIYLSDDFANKIVEYTPVA
ncbi:MAG TPA: hypothetical protein VF458_20530 [Ktedonobacteraceae bacterium]